MSRRTKEELEATGYYQWLEFREEIKAKKAKGDKLTPAEKALFSSAPTEAKPFRRPGLPAKKAAPAPEEEAPYVRKEYDTRDGLPPNLEKIPWGAEKEFKVAAGHFLCEVRHSPFEDYECMFFCKRDDCPFYLKGYFRSKGIKP